MYEATVQATEEAIINAMLAAKTMTGADYYRVPALPHDRLRAVLRKYGRLMEEARAGLSASPTHLTSHLTPSQLPAASGWKALQIGRYGTIISSTNRSSATGKGNRRRNSSAVTPSMARRWRPKLWGEEYSSR